MFPDAQTNSGWHFKMFPDAERIVRTMFKRSRTLKQMPGGVYKYSPTPFRPFSMFFSNYMDFTAYSVRLYGWGELNAP
jgi:hypothetical protein